MEIRHRIQVGDTVIELTPADAQVVIRGTLPRPLAQKLAERGITVPRRGTVPFFIEGWQDGVRVFRSEAHMRQVPPR